MTIAWPHANMSFPEWADALHLTRPDIEIQPINPTEDNWQEYGNHVAQSQLCQTYQVPRTDHFKDWRDWATAMIRSFGSAA